MKKFDSEESQNIMKQFKSIISSRLDKLYDRFGPTADGELYAYSIAVNSQRRKQEKEPTIEEPMNSEKLKEMIQAALSKPLSEKKKSFPDLTGDGKVTQADILKARGVIDEYKSDADLIADEPISEDLDLGHQDNEPHMIKAELAHIAKYAMELYRIVDQFEGPQEVDFPGWWQSKITTARNMISSAKHYLEFELEEPKLDALVGVADQEDMINEKMSKKQVKKRGKIYDALKDQGMSDEKAGRIATSKAQKIKEAVLTKLKESKGEYAQIEKQIANLKSKGKNAGDKEMQKLIKRRAELEKSKK
jgi:hypothetical protein